MAQRTRACNPREERESVLVASAERGEKTATTKGRVQPAEVWDIRNLLTRSLIIKGGSTSLPYDWCQLNISSYGGHLCWTRDPTERADIPGAACALVED